MSTQVYGYSDDLIEVDGDIVDEIDHYYNDEDFEDKGILFLCSDGTLFTVKYGKGNEGIWQITLLYPGSLYNGLEHCYQVGQVMKWDPKIENKSNQEITYSDVIHFSDGMQWIYTAKDWRKINKLNKTDYMSGNWKELENRK